MPPAEWFARVDYLVLLQAPSFERVYEWRQRQEDKLAARLAAAGQTGTRLMDGPTLRRFIQHYERLTRHGLEALPAHADVVYALTPEQTIAACRKGGRGQSSTGTLA
jgi:D-glycerate 3-kinase